MRAGVVSAAVGVLLVAINSAGATGDFDFNDPSQATPSSAVAVASVSDGTDSYEDDDDDSSPGTSPTSDNIDADATARPPGGWAFFSLATANGELVFDDSTDFLSAESWGGTAIQTPDTAYAAAEADTEQGSEVEAANQSNPYTLLATLKLTFTEPDIDAASDVTVLDGKATVNGSHVYIEYRPVNHRWETSYKIHQEGEQEEFLEGTDAWDASSSITEYWYESEEDVASDYESLVNVVSHFDFETSSNSGSLNRGTDCYLGAEIELEKQ